MQELFLLTWPGCTIIIIIQNKFDSIVPKRIDNGPDLSAVLKAFLLYFLV